MRIRFGLDRLTILLFVTAFGNALSFYTRYMNVLYPIKFVLLLALVFFLLWKTRFRFRHYDKKTLLYSSLWCAYLVVSAAWTSPGFQLDGLLLSGSYAILIVLAFALLPTIATSEQVHYRVIRALVWGLACTLATAVIMSFLEGAVSYSLGRTRYYIGMNNPNTVAAFAFTVFAGGLSLQLMRRRLDQIFLMALAWIAIILTDSRTGLIASCLLLALYLWFRLYHRLVSLLRLTVMSFVASCFTLAVAFVFSLPLNWDRLVSGRIAIWRTALASLESTAWLFGRGTGDPLGAHNYFVQQLYSGGIVAVFLLSLLLVAVWKSSGRISSLQRRSFIRALLVVWLLYSLSENILLTGGNIASIYVWMEIGISTARIRPVAPAVGTTL